MPIATTFALAAAAVPSPPTVTVGTFTAMSLTCIAQGFRWSAQEQQRQGHPFGRPRADRHLARMGVDSHGQRVPGG
ncbi:hypothetical protein A4R43_10535 [Amycolatopsis albispora]|uniref:Uncharacterized protein n=1 Tax=Amycolatopsis albispora TaxID=1804986 RepID=A0A344L4F0_9PSEU|nr:hypothetical protein A4R43_10535 [Amycolatopsis albispora]